MRTRGKSITRMLQNGVVRTYAALSVVLVAGIVTALILGYGFTSTYQSIPAAANLHVPVSAPVNRVIPGSRASTRPASSNSPDAIEPRESFNLVSPDRPVIQLPTTKTKTAASKTKAQTTRAPQPTTSPDTHTASADHPSSLSATNAPSSSSDSRDSGGSPDSGTGG
ncbi:MAG: hypothetical protein ACYDGN_02215 [Acidimicrobiales bacterium]